MIKMSNKKRKHVLAVVLMMIAFVFISPLILTMTGSFMASDEITEKYYEFSETDNSIPEMIGYFFLRFVPNKITLSNYNVVLVETQQFLKMFWNSVFLVVPIVLGQVLISSMAAFVFAKVQFRGREVIFFSYIIIMMMPFQVTLVPNYFTLNWLNLLDTRAAIILPGIFSAFGVFLLRQFMMSIPNDYIESAKIDGANLFTIFFKIVFPITKGGIASLAILGFIDNWNMVEQPLIFLDDISKHPLSIYLSSVSESEIGVLFTAGFIYLLPLIIMFLYGENYLVEGVSNSTTKG
ncbi:MAG: carbohydrate ABC transporter permease [Clostridiales bacterium]|nr:carbohydrate ABC transporter permease [Clostridiales bacterium]